MVGIGLHFGSAASTDNFMKFYGQPRNHGFIPCLEKRFFPIFKTSRLALGSVYSVDTMVIFCMGKAARRESDHLP